MPKFPDGLNLLNVRRRQGVLSNYDIILRDTMSYSNFILFDKYYQSEVKNFGQLFPTYKSEVYILELLENLNKFPCRRFLVEPLYVNGIAWTGGNVRIPFSETFAILPNGSNSDIYAATDVVNKQILVRYTVPYSVSDLWYYLENCQFPPNPYSGSGGALGGDSFLNL